jgi:hypothetical protein
MDWERVEFGARVVLVPVIFLAATSGVVYGAVFLALGRAMERLLGFGLLMAALAGFMFGLWWAFGRPKHWFAPGENTEFNPRR